ncbi:restriction endonuclease subunit S [Lacticaseibacillus paracasei]|uniref:restriction endonuclease subunit S n=1 Tax=Lacticaseibacillus paracasei TaxID=1597 RepID=UPI00234BB3A7|nr:restriction endonuclease subunit S [Lacticaseibacillus paracasei]MDC6273589.1 restriction endonuclease subunit S [Lacticaseibacillus paracasei]MDN4553727.1 restriction endonuclease subunit S [Lacticaseibacillus paracasei]
MSKDAKNVPALRFKGYSDAWEKRKVSDYLCESRIPGSNGLKAKKLTVKLWGKGVVPKNETYSGSIKTKYYVRSANQLIYGKLDFLHAAFGIVPQSLDGWESTIDSPAFDVNTSIGNAAFLLALFLRPNFYLREGIRANGSRKAKRIHEDTFLSMSISAPQRKEQDQIAVVLDKTELLIAATQHRIDTLEHVKKALLQHVLDQSWRFKGFTDHWKRHKISDIFRVTRGKVLPTSSVANQKSLATPFPVYSSQTKHDGLLGYYHDYLYADAITWTTDGANAGMVKYRPQKFYSTNVNGVLISTQGYANTAVASILNTIAWKYVSHVGNPKLMGKVMADISLELPSIPEQKALSSLLENLNNTIRTTNVKLSKIQLLKSSLLQQLFI